MITILDNIVGNSTFESDCIQILENNTKNTNEKNFNERWYSFAEDHIFRDFCVQMINVAGNFYDLTSCKGYEFWSQNNTRPQDWHIDQDEQLVAKTNQTRFPLCSMVYYVKVNDLKGGKLHIEDDIITPKTNRLVIFSPQLNHCVDPFIGDRISFCVNPWSVKL
tara:strand:+ start:3013 stop:3504 length:492 start_codon:yes stop_codon:yes gene_type:complete